MSSNNDNQAIMDRGLIEKESTNGIYDPTEYGTPVSKKFELIFFMVTSLACIVLITALYYIYTYRTNIISWVSNI